MILRLLRSIKRKMISPQDRVVKKNGNEPIQGNVLVSYIIYPFLVDEKTGFNEHTNQWECLQIVKTFIELGYDVDVINWDNKTFIPKKKYDVVVDIHDNLERLTNLLPANCIKILHITGSHWLFQNNAEYSRLENLKKRKGVVLIPRRIVNQSYGIENCNYATILGDGYCRRTFEYANKPMYSIPLSNNRCFEFPNGKDFDKCKKTFLWLGGGGLVHKGLDLLLEAFKALSEYHLIICGNIEMEKDFCECYKTELFNTSNISIYGWINTSSEEFYNLSKKCLGIIYPSCSEGQAGSVISALHVGLIPIVSEYSGIDASPFGRILEDCSIETVKKTIIEISEIDSGRLFNMSKKVWEYARLNHTRENFTNKYKLIINEILKMGKKLNEY